MAWKISIKKTIICMNEQLEKIYWYRKLKLFRWIESKYKRIFHLTMKINVKFSDNYLTWIIFFVIILKNNYLRKAVLGTAWRIR